jgi:hypothetical protein
VLARKLHNYCLYVGSPDCAAEFGPPSPQRTRIVVNVPAPPPAEIVELLWRVHAESAAPARLEIEVSSQPRPGPQPG